MLVLSKVDPDHHDLEARLDAICRTLLGSDADHDWQLIVMIVEFFWTVQNYSTINKIATTDLKIW